MTALIDLPQSSKSDPLLRVGNGSQLLQQLQTRQVVKSVAPCMVACLQVGHTQPQRWLMAMALAGTAVAKFQAPTFGLALSSIFVIVFNIFCPFDALHHKQHPETLVTIDVPHLQCWGMTHLLVIPSQIISAACTTTLSCL